MMNWIPSNDLSVTELVNMLSTQDVDGKPVPNYDNRRMMMTDVVRVPTSEHVAQIVGKSGSKIKALRAKTNTCIKTPLRNDNPVFSITGSPYDVKLAKEAIQQASDYFTKLMASRSSSCAPGEVTILVPVPQEYVGVVVGRNGSVVLKIKEQTNTRINTPREDVFPPSFEIIGSKMNVEAAKEAIEERVSQARQLRNSSCFDPNLRDKYLRVNFTPSPQNHFPMLSPIGPPNGSHQHHEYPNVYNVKNFLNETQKIISRNNSNGGNLLYDDLYNTNNLDVMASSGAHQNLFSNGSI